MVQCAMFQARQIYQSNQAVTPLKDETSQEVGGGSP